MTFYDPVSETNLPITQFIGKFPAIEQKFKYLIHHVITRRSENLNKQEFRDCYQSCKHSLAKACLHYTGKAKFSTYLYKIVINRVIDFNKTRYTHNYLQYPKNLKVPDIVKSDAELLSTINDDERRLICDMLLSGYKKKDIRTLLGYSKTNFTKVLQKIGKRIINKEPL